MTTPTSDQSAGATTLSLSELVTRTAVPASTVHHYLRCGLIPPPNRCAPNRFSYDERHVTALRLIRVMRDKRGLGLEEIAVRLPDLLTRSDIAAALAEADPDGEPGTAARLVDAAIDAFQIRSYGEVTVADIADGAGVAKGSVYRHFASKEALFTAAIERVLDDTAADFAAAVERLGGPEGVAAAPERAAKEFARLVAGTLPLLLELGARAAKGHRPSQDLARRVLRTLATAAGRPLSAPGPQAGPTGNGSAVPAGRAGAGSGSVGEVAECDVVGRPGSPARRVDGGPPGPTTGRGGADPIPAGLDIIQEAFSVVLSWAVGTDWPESLSSRNRPRRRPPRPRGVGR